MSRFILTVLRALVLASLCVIATESRASYAKYEQYNRPIFIAHLQSHNNAQLSESILNGFTPFTLTLAVETEYLSDRRLTRLWRESLGINTSVEDQSREAQTILQLYDFIAFDLARGDRFKVIYDPDTGTQLQINESSPLSMEGSRLGLLMLRGLLGNVPLSTEFKQALLSPDPAPGLAAVYNSLQPQSDRVALPASALQASNPNTDDLQQTSVSPAAEVEIPSTANANISATESERETISQGLAPLKTVTQTEYSPATVAAKERAPQQNKVKINTDNKPGENANTANSEPSVVTSSDISAESASLILVRQSYQASLESAIRKYQTIPFKAFSRRMEGEVVLHIAVDEQGNVTRLDIVTPSRYDVLNDQALDAVTSAEPLDPIPQVLGLEEFSFQINLLYDLVY